MQKAEDARGEDIFASSSRLYLCRLRCSAQVDCFIRAGERAQQRLEAEYRSRGFWSAGLQRLWSRVQQISQQVEQVYQSGEGPVGGNPLADILVGTVLQTGSQALAEQFLKGWQWAFANVLEMLRNA